MSSHDEFDMPVKPSREEQAARMRAANPECAAMVDEMRDLFGDVEVLAITEAGRFTARKNYKADSSYSAVLDGEAFLRLGKLDAEAKAIAEGKQTNAKR